MGQSLGCYHTQNLRHTLNHEHKLQLKQLLELQQTLKHPGYPHIIRGLEGMLAAHNLLKKKETIGILIGGLSETVWHKQCTPQDLLKHKDVDVMVVSPKNNIKRFERGIDWWLPHEEKIDIITEYSQQLGVNKRWWKNGNGVVLSFGVQQHYDLSAGLYIPNSSFVCKMREYEVLANVDTQIEYEAIEAFERQMEKRVKTTVPKFIQEKFKEYILSDKYEPNYRKVDAIELTQFDRDTMKAIYKKEGIKNKE